MITSDRLQIGGGQNFDVDLEYNKDFVIVHLRRLDKIDKQTIIEIRDYLQSVLKFVKTCGYDQLYAGIFIDNDVVNRLAEVYCGFEYLGSDKTLNVYRLKEI